MTQYVFVSEHGDDKHDGLEENRPVRSTSRAIRISLRTGREVKVLDHPEAGGRHGNELERQRKAS